MTRVCTLTVVKFRVMSTAGKAAPDRPATLAPIAKCEPEKREPESWQPPRRMPFSAVRPQTLVSGGGSINHNRLEALYSPLYRALAQFVRLWV